MRGNLAGRTRLYELTRVYLMLGGAGPLDAGLVREWIAAGLRRAYPATTRRCARKPAAAISTRCWPSRCPPCARRRAGRSRARQLQPGAAGRARLCPHPSLRRRGRAAALAPGRALGPGGRRRVQPAPPAAADRRHPRPVHRHRLPQRAAARAPAAARQVAAETWVIGRTHRVRARRDRASSSAAVKALYAPSSPRAGTRCWPTSTSRRWPRCRRRRRRSTSSPRRNRRCARCCARSRRSSASRPRPARRSRRAMPPLVGLDRAATAPRWSARCGWWPTSSSRWPRSPRCRSAPRCRPAARISAPPCRPTPPASRSRSPAGCRGRRQRAGAAHRQRAAAARAGLQRAGRPGPGLRRGSHALPVHRRRARRCRRTSSPACSAPPGVLDGFLNTQLKPYVDTTSSPGSLNLRQASLLQARLRQARPRPMRPRQARPPVARHQRRP